MKHKLSFLFLAFVLLFFSNAFAEFNQKDSLGLVIIPAENYDSLRVGSKGDTFADSTTFAGFLGSSYMQGSDAGVYNPYTVADTGAPALSYNINFIKTGTHYLWVRKYFIDGNNDSFYYGLGDSIHAQEDMIPHGSYGVWQWIKAPTSLDIPAAGLHTLTIYLRERGSAIDHIAVTTSDTFDPSTDLKKIVFVSKESVVDDTGEQADKVFIDDLETEGYAVNKVYSTALETASQDIIDALNDADLVIIGRSGGSSDFGGAHRAAWNAISSPVLNIHPWTARTSRLNWLNTGTTTSYDTGGDTISAKIELPDDPVFADATIAADSTMDWVSTPYDYMGTTDGGNGTVLARSASDANVFFVRWDPWEEFYDGAVDYPAGYRTLIGNGNDHAYATAGGPWNYYNFIDEAKQVYLNEVARMVELPEPPEKPRGLDKEIVFVSKESVVDDTGEQADSVFIDDLLAEKYKVITVYSTALETASQGLIDTLNAADLVIIGRSGGSSDFGGAHRAAWNAITSPTLNLHPWTARTSRLNWLNTGTTTSYDTGGDTISAKIELPDDPVFADATIAADSTMDWVSTPYDYMGITDGGNGTVLARSASDANVFFVRWDAWVEFYSGAGDKPAGYRTLIGNGNDHAYATAGGPWNYYNFIDEAKEVYLKEVARMAALGKVEEPITTVAYVTNADKQADLVEGAAPVNDDPIIRMLKADENFEVDVLAVAPDSVIDLSGYDVVVAQESFNSGSAIFKPGGSLGFASIPVPFLYNKMYAMKDTRGFQGGAAGSGAEIEGTFTIDVDPTNQGNDLFKGLTFKNNQLKLFRVGADDNGGTTRTKGLNYATGVVISDTTTLLGIQTGAPAEATVGINDVPAGTQFGSETLQARMITVGYNFGALVSNDGHNITSAGLTIWRNAIYSLAGLEVPAEPVFDPYAQTAVAYVTNADKQADLVEGAAPVNDDPIIRLLKADDNFEVDVFAVAPDSVIDLSGYDVVVAQESFNSGSAIFKPGGSLGFASIPVPFLYNKMYAMKDTRGFQGGAAGSGAEIEGTFTIDVDPANQGNDLFKGLTFEDNQLTLLSGGADDNGGDSRTKGLNYATGVVISDTTTLLGIQTGAPAEATVGINDVPAGTQFGSETLQARMITVGFNFGALVRNDGKNLTSAGLTIWRNAVYSLAGLEVPADPVVVEDIESDTRNIPTVYTLGQNYPNPFNPTTSIKISLPKAGKTTLKLYNSLGQLVSTIVDKDMNAGIHTVTFNASRIATGVYFYRIESGEFTKVKKMVLIK